MRYGAGAHHAGGAGRGGRGCSLVLLLATAAALVALGTVSYTLVSLRSLRGGGGGASLLGDDADGAGADGGAPAAAAAAAAGGDGGARPAGAVAQLLRRLEERVEKMAASVTAGGGSAAGGDAAAAQVAALQSLSERLDAVSAQVAGLPAKIREAAAAAGAAPAAAAAAAAPAPAAASCPRNGGSGRNVVLGMAKGIELPNLYAFVRSLRTHGGPGLDIVIFTDDTPQPLAWVYEAYGVTVERFSVGALQPEKARAFHPSSYRWMLIRDWMKAKAAAAAGGQPPYDNVLFIDVRDSVFQSDPFAPIAGKPGLYAFLEAKPRTIAECGWNSGWVRGECAAAEGCVEGR